MERLAIYSLNLGLPSETFIRQHIERLATGNTVVVTGGYPGPPAWTVDEPAYFVRKPEQMAPSLPRALHALVPWERINPGDRRGIARFLREQRVSVLMGQYLHDSWHLLPVARRLGIRYFAHAHGYDLSRIFRSPTWRRRYRDFKAADGIIIVNDLMRDRMAGLGVAPERIHKIPYGVAVPERPVEHQAGPSMNLLAVGRLVGKKAPRLLLTAFREALRREPGLTLSIVGDGAEFRNTEAFIVEHGLSQRVTLHGSRDHEFVLELMQRCDCFVQHSIVDPQTGDEEGVPVSILEAMAHALPVISTRHAGIPDAVVEGETGLLVDEGDAEGMANHIVELSRSPEKRRRLGRAGWQRARDRFSFRRERDELRAVLGLEAPTPNCDAGR